MTSKELRITREHMGVSKAQVARWLKVSPLTVLRWEKGTAPIPGPAEVAIMALAYGWRP